MRKHPGGRWSRQLIGVLAILSLCLVTLSLAQPTVAAADGAFQPPSPLVITPWAPLAAWWFIRPPNPYLPPLAWAKITKAAYPNQLAAQASIEGVGEVVRVSQSPPGMGVVFRKLSPASMELINRIYDLFERKP